MYYIFSWNFWLINILECVVHYLYYVVIYGPFISEKRLYRKNVMKGAFCIIFIYYVEAGGSLALKI